MSEQDSFFLGSHQISSRLILGTGKYKTLELMQQCHQAAETAMVTVALRRVPLDHSDQKSILDFIDTSKIEILPNTSGSQKAEDALRLAKMARAMGLKFLKLEIMAESKTLLPDPVETLRATRLIKEDAEASELYLMVYTSDDPVIATRLLEAGADCIMPAGSPIGSGQGILNRNNIELLLRLIDKKVPIILDAGIGCASDAAFAMELGLDAVLMNSAVAQARDSVLMAEAMKNAVRAGRQGYLAGRMPKKLYATASSPLPDQI